MQNNSVITADLTNRTFGACNKTCNVLPQEHHKTKLRIALILYRRTCAPRYACSALVCCSGPTGSGTGSLGQALVLLPLERLRGTANPLRRWSLPTERLRGMIAPNGAGAQGGGIGSPAQEASAAHRAPTGAGSPQRRGPTSRGNREFCPAGGRCLRGVYGGW